MLNKEKCLLHILKIANEKRISQSKLIEGFYDYSHFNRMCNGKEPINMEVVLYCADKLGIQYDDLKRFSNDDSSAIINDYILEFNRLKDCYNYKGIEDFYHSIKQLKEDTPAFKQLKMMVSAFIIYHYDNEPEKAMNILFEALKLTLNKTDIFDINFKSLSDLELTIINNISICYFYIGSNEYALQILEKLVQEISDDSKKMNHIYILIKAHYNLSFFNLHTKNYTIAKDLAKKGINLSIKWNYFTFLCYLYYSYSLGSYKLNDFKQFKEYMDLSFFQAISQNNKENFITILKSDIQKYNIPEQYYLEYIS